MAARAALQAGCGPQTDSRRQRSRGGQAAQGVQILRHGRGGGPAVPLPEGGPVAATGLAGGGQRTVAIRPYRGGQDGSDPESSGREGQARFMMGCALISWLVG